MAAFKRNFGSRIAEFYLVMLRTLARLRDHDMARAVGLALTSKSDVAIESPLWGAPVERRTGQGTIFAKRGEIGDDQEEALRMRSGARAGGLAWMLLVV